MYLGSRNRMTSHALELFPDPTLEHAFARAICSASVLPRKEWFETIAVVRRIQRKDALLDDAVERIVDVGAGHGLLGLFLGLVDKHKRPVLLVEPNPPQSRAKLLAAIGREFPALISRVSERHERIDAGLIGARDLVVSSHGCGELSDTIIDAAISKRARVVVLPCCQSRKSHAAAVLAAFMDPALALDAARALRLDASGYKVWTACIDAEITPKNRLIMAVPAHGAVAAHA